MGITSNEEHYKIDTIRRLLFIVYVLLIFEGALRKWILPQLSSVLFFSKDPFILYIYYLCLKHRLFPKNKIALFSYYLSLFFFVFAYFQTFINPFPFFVTVYGWRNYFMFMPLSFIMAKYCDFNFIKRIAKFTCYVSIPIAVLTYIQHKSPADAFINKNVGGSKTEVFTVARGIVRPSGTFSFNNGQTFFITSLLLMLLFNYFLNEKQRFIPPWIAYLSFLSFFSNLAVSGSRSAYGSSLLTIVFLIIASLLLINKKKSASILSLTIVGTFVAVILLSTVFAEQLELIFERQAIASGSEGSIFDRIFTAFFISTDEEIPLLGYGLGIGSVGGSFLATGANNFGLAETEWARIELENGYVFGFIYIGYRLFLAYLILKDSFYATIKSGQPIPVLVTSFIFPTIAIGQMTMNGTTLAYGWIFLGYALAVNRIYINGEYKTEDEGLMI